MIKAAKIFLMVLMGILFFAAIYAVSQKMEAYDLCGAQGFDTGRASFNWDDGSTTIQCANWSKPLAPERD